MNTKKPKRRYLIHHLLILCCLTFCLSACPCTEITVSGKITCDAYTSGPIYIGVFDIEKGMEYVGGYTINDLNEGSDYTITLTGDYLNKLVYVNAIWDPDDNFYDTYDYTIGDYWSTYRWETYDWALQLECINNNIDININQKITATIEGEILGVTCDEFTSGIIYISAYDDNDNWISMPTGPPLSEPGPYKIFIRNVEPGNSVWVMGWWDRDKSGPAFANTGDCAGKYKDITLVEETTGIDFYLDHEKQ